MDKKEIEETTIPEKEKHESSLEKQLKVLLELVKANQLLVLRGWYRTDKKANIILGLSEGSFKIHLVLDDYYALGAASKASFFIPITVGEVYWVGDISIKCSPDPRSNIVAIKIIFNLHYPEKGEDSFRLNLSPQTMGKYDSSSFIGLDFSLINATI